MPAESEEGPHPAPAGMKHLHVTLDPNGVGAPLKRAAVIATQVVGTCLRALANDDLSTPELRAGFVGYRFGGLDVEGDERRDLMERWLFAKAFQDLARGVREMLEEASFYLTMIKMEAGVTTINKLDGMIASARLAAQRPSFPQLLQAVNAGLREPIAFEAEYLSLQKVRNCLEHRAGAVSTKDVDPATGLLTLTFPRLKTYYVRAGEEIEIERSEVISETEETALYLRRVTRTREYAVGDPVKITLTDLAEIALACQMFADDLVLKLPTLPPMTSGPAGAQ